MLSIGAFSRLGHISVRMLRHYDAIGLLPPAHVDTDTGYRYYDWQQLETLGKIETLKGYQFPLARIKELLALDAHALDAALHAKRIALFEEMAHLQKILRRLDENIGQMEDLQMQNQAYEVIVMEAQPQPIFGISRHIHVGQIHDLFQDLHAEMDKRGLKQADAGILIYHGEAFSYDDMDVEAAFPIAGGHPDARILAGGPYACTIHRGRYDSLKCAYEAIAKWLGDQAVYEIAGPGFERYIRDEEDGASPDEYETGVLFPLKKTGA